MPPGDKLPTLELVEDGSTDFPLELSGVLLPFVYIPSKHDCILKVRLSKIHLKNSATLRQSDVVITF